MKKNEIAKVENGVMTENAEIYYATTGKLTERRIKDMTPEEILKRLHHAEEYYNNLCGKYGELLEELIKRKEWKPVVYAHWELTHDFDDVYEAMRPLGRVIRCSNCLTPTGHIETPFCPYCGARMLGVEPLNDKHKGEIIIDFNEETIEKWKKEEKK